MPRAATTNEVFNAIAEPRRRQIIELLARRGQLAAGAVVVAVGLPQPAVSKHLGVLLKVGVVSVDKHGRQRVYRLNPQDFRPVYEWAKMIEQLWCHQLNRIKQRAERNAGRTSNF